MKVTVLHIEDCPNLEPLMEDLHELLRGRSDVTLTVVPVLSDEDAARLGFHGSPTVLIDGVDPFPAPPEPVGLSCRQYPCCRDAAGRVPGFPTGEKLAEAIGGSAGDSPAHGHPLPR